MSASVEKSVLRIRHRISEYPSKVLFIFSIDNIQVVMMIFMDNNVELLMLSTVDSNENYAIFSRQHQMQMAMITSIDSTRYELLILSSVDNIRCSSNVNVCRQHTI